MKANNTLKLTYLIYVPIKCKRFQNEVLSKEQEGGKVMNINKFTQKVD